MDIICDLDGTLADISHRLGFVRTEPRNWEAFEAGIPFDKINEHVLFLLKAYSSKGKLFLASGRMESSRKQTEDFLKKHNIHNIKNADEKSGIFYEKLFMRPLDDTRPDVEIKEEILEKIKAYGGNPEISIDDRLSVCRMWHERGIYTICVNQGLEEF